MFRKGKLSKIPAIQKDKANFGVGFRALWQRWFAKPKVCTQRDDSHVELDLSAVINDIPDGEKNALFDFEPLEIDPWASTPEPRFHTSREFEQISSIYAKSKNR